MQDSDRTRSPQLKDIQKLPRWACVAFAARCAQRVQPLFQHFWPKAAQKHIDAIDKAIMLAASSARVGRADDAVSNAADAAADAAYAANAVANVAAAVFAYAADAVANAANANAANMMAWRDYDILLALNKREGWTDNSPVDPDLCGPLWADGAPKGWPINDDSQSKKKPSKRPTKK